MRQNSLSAFASMARALCLRVNKQAMTLTELLVATALIGIVLIGVISVEYAVRSAEQTTSASTLVAMKAGTVLLDISKNGSLATGNETDPGVHDLTGAFHELCFRQDRNSPQTPNVNTDDTWKCYIHDNGNILSTCTVNAVPNGNLIACQAASDYRSLSDNVVSLTSSFVHNATTPGSEFAVDVSLTIRKIAAQAVQPLTNPEITLSTRLLPSNHSW